MLKVDMVGKMGKQEYIYGKGSSTAVVTVALLYQCKKEERVLQMLDLCLANLLTLQVTFGAPCFLDPVLFVPGFFP